MFKRHPSLSEQAKLHIKERILNNEFEEGRIPSENDLAQDLGVSRTTIREALRGLEVEGTIYRRQGSGTFVNKPGLQIKSRLEEMWSYEELLRAHGYTPSVEVLEIFEEPAGPQLAGQLQIDAGEMVLVIAKLFREDDEPVILTTNRVPGRYLQGDCDAAAGRRPVYEFLETCCQQQLLYYLSEIVPLRADEEVARRLQWPPGSALIALDEVGYNTEHEPILQSRSYFRDDLLRFRLIRRRI